MKCLRNGTILMLTYLLNFQCLKIVKEEIKLLHFKKHLPEQVSRPASDQDVFVVIHEDQRVRLLIVFQVAHAAPNRLQRLFAVFLNSGSLILLIENLGQEINPGVERIDRAVILEKRRAEPDRRDPRVLQYFVIFLNVGVVKINLKLFRRCAKRDE